MSRVDRFIASLANGQDVSKLIVNIMGIPLPFAQLLGVVRSMASDEELERIINVAVTKWEESA